MATVNGSAAIAWMRAHGTNTPGDCLNTVWQAYGSHDSIGPHAGQYPDAIDGWNYATDKHAGDEQPPAGVPVYFGVSPTRTDADRAAGDVCISLGGGQLIATDAAGNGRIGITTITQRAAQTARPYLGWTGDFLGYTVTYTPTTNTTTTKGTDMLIGIKGKAGARRGGSYYVNGGVAHFIGAGIPAGVPTYTDEGEIAALQHVISGLA
ncbi:hypothetical protein [Humibacter ginsenosidimutans]|uniref:Uncharacterized protein n=1 Tax=Humibacter ginsenosidimutans TaxID=2599293 RepID=A0A5B8M3F1_9MICO|nr:hypothetical protein [Humibacter ginsenosidimutans]QDZ14252.1 hypothetical protein FPZ11_05255 [Humibacter ginsenosidimutans]